MTISVNSVVGAHLLVSRDFSFHSVCNELCLVLIGITAALIVNLFHDYQRSKKDIIANMRYTESQLQMAMGALAAYLSGKEMQFSVWDNICNLENACRFLSRTHMSISQIHSLHIRDIILITLR